LHFNRFFPHYKLTSLPPTPIETLEVGLKYVYIGNAPGHAANSTYRPECGQSLIHRVHFMVLENNLVGGRRRFCGAEMLGIWE